ncbi:uncharacterized protein LOC132947469 [Metopolophium dirhodum]|uniref:uncharacterized protein LOC132947469 n=1 Tax=Metopolophium dirhodum TaxID=44670 RepID=UPI00298FA299|nr:uncharacterized protein LOC132947469 [Metopolophium dirhodum]
MDNQNLNDLFACVVPKVQIWSCFDPIKSYKWAYKWNGVKAKMMIQNDMAFVWPDADAVHTKPYIGNGLKLLDSINFQVELMSMCIVLVQAICVSFFDKLYVIEPSTSVKFLDHLRPLLTDACAVQSLDNSTYLPICVQKFYDSPRPDDYDKSLYDGFILTQDTMLIKWKQPTIDAKYLGARKFMVGNGTKLITIIVDASERAEEKCEVDCIYELSPKLSILRKRTDRLLCSTYREYEIFVKSLELM